MSVARLFGFKSDNEVAAKLAAVETHQVATKLRGKLASLKQKKEGGFTLLELLVVVAILAAVAGTATIILRDTDRKASAAAHVAMMDELSKGILTYRVLNNGQYPDVFDSLTYGDNAAIVGTQLTAVLNDGLSGSFGVSAALTADDVTYLKDYGITELRVIDETNAVDEPEGAAAGECDNATIKALINRTDNAVTNSNIFRSPNAHGCGHATNHALIAGDTLVTWDTSAATGASNAARVKMPVDSTIYAFGIGPDSTLFDPRTKGALNNTPTYRHVTQDEYNRFVGLFGINTTNTELELVAIVDGAGDTKDEELGEWDGTRGTL
jgi:prepilin-type N-terminal cleavage/methylation domain-containing protein